MGNKNPIIIETAMKEFDTHSKSEENSEEEKLFEAFVNAQITYLKSKKCMDKRYNFSLQLRILTHTK